MKAFVTVIVLMFGAGPVFSGPLNDQVASQSRYYGVSWQSDGNHWSIEAIVGKNGAQIAYPSIECTGDWALLEQSNAMLRYRETITDGIDDCVSQGVVLLEPRTDGQLLYTWKETPETVDARAILLPVNGPRLTYMELLKLTLDKVDYDYLWPEFRE